MGVRSLLEQRSLGDPMQNKLAGELHPIDFIAAGSRGNRSLTSPSAQFHCDSTFGRFRQPLRLRTWCREIQDCFPLRSLVNRGGVSEVTRILDRVQQGETKAVEELLPLVYEELRRLAAHKMANEAAGQTLQPTALVHEAWLRLVGNQPPRFDGRGHFFAAAAEAMRRILIENARRKARLKRGGEWERMNLDDVQIAVETDPAILLGIDEALEKLACEHAEKAELVKLRFFAGLTLSEAARAMNLSETTAKRYWTFARAWLHAELEDDG